MTIKEREEELLSMLEAEGESCVEEALKGYLETKSEAVYLKVLDVLFDKYKDKEDADDLVDDEVATILNAINSSKEEAQQEQESKEEPIEEPIKSNSNDKYWYYNSKGQIVSLASAGITVEEARASKRLVLEENGYYYLNSKKNCIF